MHGVAAWAHEVAAWHGLQLGPSVAVAGTEHLEPRQPAQASGQR